jgi:hypothetical protein
MDWGRVGNELDVRSCLVMDWIWPELLRFFCPGLADVLEGRETVQRLQMSGLH